MNDVIPLRARPNRDDRSARIGMIVFIAGWTMMFGALLVAYLLLRADQPAWPPAGLPAIEPALPTLATTVLVASSATLQLGLGAVRTARPRDLVLYLVITLVLGTLFLVLQTTTWRHMVRRGLSPTGSLYGASFFGLTGFHAAHAAVGLAGLATLLPRARRGAFSVNAHTAVRSWTLYWHFVDAVWLVFFALVVMW